MYMFALYRPMTSQQPCSRQHQFSLTQFTAELMCVVRHGSAARSWDDLHDMQVARSLMVSCNRNTQWRHRTHSLAQRRKSATWKPEARGSNPAQSRSTQWLFEFRPTLAIMQPLYGRVSEKRASTQILYWVAIQALYIEENTNEISDTAVIR